MPVASLQRCRAAALGVLLTSWAAVGCDCEGTGVGSGRSSLAVSQARVDLGRVFLGSAGSRTIQLLAEGDLAVAYRAALAGDAFGFAVGPASGTLAPNGEHDIRILFRPGRAGRIEARLIFDGDATEVARVEVALIAEGVEPPDCEDGNGCTVDTFDLSAMRCVHLAAPVACTDFSACTMQDTCVEGVCLGQPVSCNDGNPCTDDLCDPLTGCLNVPTRDCDDGNPCTADRCEGLAGCVHEDALDGTPCDDFEVCSTADICLGGDCVGVAIPEGTMCDDGEPCSKEERCIAGECRDPNFHRPELGEVVYTTTVGALAADASANPILDRDGTVFVGLGDGVAAVDQCGERLWARHDLGAPTWRAATSLPGRLLVPVNDTWVALDARNGATLGALALEGLAPADTSSTATVTIGVVDAALRGSGAIVASVRVRVDDRAGVRETGALVEIDRALGQATVFRRLGSSVARRLVIDRDEALVVALSDGARERVVRFGLDGLPETSWSTSASSTAATDLALGAAGEVLWSHGLTRVTTRGQLSTLIAPSPVAAAGAPIVGLRSRVFVLSPVTEPSPALMSAWWLSAVDTPTTTQTASVAWRAPIVGSAEAVTPALDAQGGVYVVTADGVLTGVSARGEVLFRTSASLSLAEAAEVALGITPRGDVVVAGDGRVSSIRGMAGLAGSPWPRHRRDNLSTGHR